MMAIDIPEGYEALGIALGEAVAQASHGKGAERHAGSGEKFSDQLIMSIPKRLGPGGECFCLGQALKKICESRRLEPAHARAEILGAINYLAAAWCLLGGGESVSAPERLFRPGEDVEISMGGEWRPAAYVRPEDGGLHTVLCGTSHFAVRPSAIRKPSPAPEDAPESRGMPLFAEGTAVEYCMKGVWKRGVYVGVDPEGSHVVESRGTRLHLDGILLRKA